MFLKVASDDYISLPSSQCPMLNVHSHIRIGRIKVGMICILLLVKMYQGLQWIS